LWIHLNISIKFLFKTQINPQKSNKHRSGDIRHQKKLDTIDFSSSVLDFKAKIEKSGKCAKPFYFVDIRIISTRYMEYYLGEPYDLSPVEKIKYGLNLLVYYV